MSGRRGSAIGTLLGIAIIGGFVWGGAAVGHAIGLYGGIGLLAGGGIIAAGILAIGVVAVGGYCLAKACASGYRSLRDRYHSYRAVREQQHDQQARSIAGMSTRSIQQGLNAGVGSPPLVDEQPSAPVLYPPLYQEAPRDYVQNASQYNDPAYYAPPKLYGYT